MSKKTKKTRAEEATAAFRNLLKLLSLYSDATARLKEMEADNNQELLQIVDDKQKLYAELQLAVIESEKAIRGICQAHLEWFATRKSIPTPYGTPGFRKSTETVIPNEEATILLIKMHAKKNPDFNLALYVRTEEVLDKESLEKLPEEQLRAFRVQRVEKENFSIKPAQIDMGKAVKEAAETTKESEAA